MESYMRKEWRCNLRDASLSFRLKFQQFRLLYFWSPPAHKTPMHVNRYDNVSLSVTSAERSSTTPAIQDFSSLAVGQINGQSGLMYLTLWLLCIRSISWLQYRTILHVYCHDFIYMCVYVYICGADIAKATDVIRVLGVLFTPDLALEKHITYSFNEKMTWRILNNEIRKKVLSQINKCHNEGAYI